MSSAVTQPAPETDTSAPLADEPGEKADTKERLLAWHVWGLLAAVLAVCAVVSFVTLRTRTPASPRPPQCSRSSGRSPSRSSGYSRCSGPSWGTPSPAGEEVPFVVTLENRGEMPFALEPCPTYRMFLIQDDAGVEEYHKLNCGATDGTIARGEAISFEMLLRSDPNLRSGNLGWQLGDVATPDAPQAEIEYRSP